MTLINIDLLKKPFTNIEALDDGVSVILQSRQGNNFICRMVIYPERGGGKGKADFTAWRYPSIVCHATVLDHKQVIVESYIYAIRFEVLTGLSQGKTKDMDTDLTPES